MNPVRELLLRASESPFLAERLPRLPPVRRSVERFMPGERLEDALEAAATLERDGIASVLTRLGENVETESEAREATEHYLRVLDEAEAAGEDAEISVKLTHLGLDQGRGLAEENLDALAAKAASGGGFVWVDMERSPYVDPTLEVCGQVLGRRDAVGVCLQSYLRRTPDDLERLLADECSVRLVKGAYDEPPEIAYPDRSAVDASYHELARRMLRSAAADGVRHGFGTHDDRLLGRIREEAAEAGLDRDDYEIQMMYGIRRDLQRRLAERGHRVRVLISYGSEWFAWFGRRLAERPANLWFVLRNLFRG